MIFLIFIIILPLNLSTNNKQLTMADNVIPLQNHFDGEPVAIDNLVGVGNFIDGENPGLENYDEAILLSNQIRVLMDQIPNHILENYLMNNDAMIPIFPLTDEQTNILHEAYELMNQLKRLIRESIVNGTNITNDLARAAMIYDYDITDDQFMVISNGNRPENMENAGLLRRLNTAGMPYGVVHSIDFSKNGHNDVIYLTHLLVDNGETVLNHIMYSIMTGFRLEMNPTNGEIQLIDPPEVEDNFFTHEWNRIEQFIGLYHANEQNLQTLIPN
jgi:hypothetical protein